MMVPVRHFAISFTLSILCSAHTLLATGTTQQFAEAYAPDDQTVQYQVSSLDVIPGDDPALNTVIVKQMEEKKILKSPAKLKRFQNGDDFMDLTEPYIHPDDPYYTVDPQLLGRQKRDIPAWQAAYRSRFLAYQKDRSIPVQQPHRKRKAHVPGRTKFARQFAGDETPFQEDNTVSDTLDQVVVQPLRDNQDEDFDTTTTTTTTEMTTRRRKKHKKRTTTAAPEETTEVPETEAPQTEAPRTAAPRIATPSRNAKNKDLESVVMALTSDMQSSGPYIPKKGEKMPLWGRPDLDSALDPRTNPEIKQLIVEKHNALRSMVSPPAGNMLKMEWSEEAGRVAQHWAEQCHFEHDPGDVRHTSKFSCGQNLARGWPSPLSWNLTMQLWFDERKDFVMDAKPRGLIGHYTALVWATSYQVGCGYADCGTFHHYVCNYCPSGNIDVRRWHPYHPASKPCAQCPDSCDETGKLCMNSCPHSNKYGNCDDLEREFSICSDASYGLQDKCEATCKCKGKIYERPKA